MRRPYRERFRLILAELGTGLAGRPQDLREVAARARTRACARRPRCSRSSAARTEIIKNFITDSDTVVAELERQKKDVARWVDEAGDTAEISADAPRRRCAERSSASRASSTSSADDGAARAS